MGTGSSFSIYNPALSFSELVFWWFWNVFWRAKAINNDQVPFKCELRYILEENLKTHPNLYVFDANDLQVFSKSKVIMYFPYIEENAISFLSQ